MKRRPLLPLRLLRLPTRRPLPPRRSDSERGTDQPLHPRPLQGRGFFFPSNFASRRVRRRSVKPHKRQAIPFQIVPRNLEPWAKLDAFNLCKRRHVATSLLGAGVAPSAAKPGRAAVLAADSDGLVCCGSPAFRLI